MAETTHEMRQIAECVWEVPRTGAMLVPGRIYADEKLMSHIRKERAVEQVANVAHLPGVVRCSLAMPDIHWGYGFPIGGVAATDPDEGGVISPGGVGYDINCGVRLLRTNLRADEVRPRMEKLVEALFRQVPLGVGRGGAYRFNKSELKKLMADGVEYLRRRGLATERDIEHTEAHGRLEEAAPDRLTPRAIERGADQCGSLGSGNHFLEIQIVEEVFHRSRRPDGVL